MLQFLDILPSSHPGSTHWAGWHWGRGWSKRVISQGGLWFVCCHLEKGKISQDSSCFCCLGRKDWICYLGEDGGWRGLQQARVHTPGIKQGLEQEWWTWKSHEQTRVGCGFWRLNMLRHGFWNMLEYQIRANRSREACLFLPPFHCLLWFPLKFILFMYLRVLYPRMLQIKRQKQKKNTLVRKRIMRKEELMD